ncbi:MAG: hypothetical protein IE923_04265, partial [Micrococcales bacterium]|nr:hypothetical protein [Micrococcales bacterium]
MARLRRPVSVVVSGALAAGLLTTLAPAASSSPAPAAGSAADELSVVELDLSGVSAAARPDLPAPESVPTDEGA